MLQTCSLQKEAQKNTIGRNQWDHNWMPCPSYEMKINSCPIAGANLVSQILSVHFYPSNRTDKSVVVWISLVWSVRSVFVNWAGNDAYHHTMITRLGLQRLLPIGLCISFELASKCCCCISFQLHVVCAWLMINCSVHLQDSVICMPWDLDIKMNWILS